MKTKSNKTIVYITIGVAIGIIILFVWDLLTSDPYDSLTINPYKIDWSSISIDNVNINALIQSLLSALISIVLTIILIEIILRESREKEIEYKRMIQLTNITKVLWVPLYKYQQAGIIISNKIGAPLQEINIDVDGHILAEVFSPCLCTDEPLLQTKIELYSSKLNDLKVIITNLLINTDLTDNQDLSDLFSDFLVYINAHNPCSRIIELNDKNKTNPEIKEFVLKHLPTTNLEEIQTDNILYPFRVLKDLLKYQRDFHIKLSEVFTNYPNQMNS